MYMYVNIYIYIYIYIYMIWFPQHRQCLPVSRIESPSPKKLASKGCGGDALRLQRLMGSLLKTIFSYFRKV